MQERKTIRSCQEGSGTLRKQKFLSIMLGTAALSMILSGCTGSAPDRGGTAQTEQAGAEAEDGSDTAETPAAQENEDRAQETDGGESIRTNGGEAIALSALEHQDESAEAVVYYTSDISAEAMTEIYHALGTGLSGDNIAVKLSTGEPPASNYLDPELIADFVVLDEDGSVSLPVEGGTRLSENLVGAHFPEYDGYLVLSHFKGHAMAGFGGAIKNISIGLASQEGKCLIHTAGESHTSPWGGEQDPFTESMAEAGKSVVDALDGNILYVSVMNHLSVDCDCDGNPAEPDMHDMGILASADPVALDQACVDLVYASEDDTASLIERMESRNGVHVLEHGEEIGLGSRSYRLVSIDG